MLVVPVIAPPQIALIARVYKPGLAESYPKAYVVSADGSGFRAVSMPGQVVDHIEWSDEELVYWVGGQAWLPRPEGAAAIGLADSEERLPNLPMTDTRLTSGDVIRWRAEGTNDWFEAFGRRYPARAIDSVSVGDAGFKIYFAERVSDMMTTVWYVDGRRRRVKEAVTSQDRLLDWNAQRQFVAFSPAPREIVLSGKKVLSSEVWVGTLGGPSTRLNLPPMELLDLEVKPLRKP